MWEYFLPGTWPCLLTDILKKVHISIFPKQYNFFGTFKLKSNLCQHYNNSKFPVILLNHDCQYDLMTHVLLYHVSFRPLAYYP